MLLMFQHIIFQSLILLFLCRSIDKLIEAKRVLYNQYAAEKEAAKAIASSKLRAEH
jgi:hypothetical protein